MKNEFDKYTKYTLEGMGKKTVTADAAITISVAAFSAGVVIGMLILKTILI